MRLLESLTPKYLFFTQHMYIEKNNNIDYIIINGWSIPLDFSGESKRSHMKELVEIDESEFQLANLYALRVIEKWMEYCK